MINNSSEAAAFLRLVSNRKKIRKISLLTLKLKILMFSIPEVN